MARCRSCSAPLQANTNICRYCGVRNDVDLHGKHAYTLHNSQSDRLCPTCNIPLQTIDLELDGPFLIERCQQCFGLFFDPGEIETLLESSVSNVFKVNPLLLTNINRERFSKKRPVRYIKCPVCQEFMQRVNFGHRSGVVIDRCHSHGVWLDNGEISHLMEWKKAGGQILSEKQQSRQSRLKKDSNSQADAIISQTKIFSRPREPDIIESVASLIFKLFD